MSDVISIVEQPQPRGSLTELCCYVVVVSFRAATGFYIRPQNKVSLPLHQEVFQRRTLENN